MAPSSVTRAYDWWTPAAYGTIPCACGVPLVFRDTPAYDEESDEENLYGLMTYRMMLEGRVPCNHELVKELT